MNEQVPSCNVTHEMLAAWGFPVQVTDKCVGSKVIVSEGMSFRAAKHAAWVAGFTRPAFESEAQRQARRPESREAMAARQSALAWEHIAFLRHHGSIIGPSHQGVTQ